MDSRKDSRLSETPRQRATAIVVRDGCILVVRDKFRPAFMLPGGGIDDGETPEVAVARELEEETTLTATAVKYLFTHDGKYNHHHVFSVEVEGEVDISHDPLVVEFAWWDGGPEVPVHPHVNAILGRIEIERVD